MELFVESNASAEDALGSVGNRQIRITGLDHSIFMSAHQEMIGLGLWPIFFCYSSSILAGISSCIDPIHLIRVSIGSGSNRF